MGEQNLLNMHNLKGEMIEKTLDMPDAFHLSMERLNFIENSYKSMLSLDGEEEEDLPLDYEEKKDIDSDFKLQLIKDILISAKNNEEKLKAIEDIVNDSPGEVDRQRSSSQDTNERSL